MNYGKELILDLHDCDATTYCDREHIQMFMEDLCDLIDMERGPLHFWDYEGLPEDYDAAPAHLKGTSAVQFIMTSSIVIHALDDMRQVYLNVFSCKDFDFTVVTAFAAQRFGGTVVTSQLVDRR